MQNKILSRPKSPRFRVGPGTLLALAVGGLLLWNQSKGRAPSPPGIGHLVYEADAQGRMRRVDTPSSAPVYALPRLWKPEPAWLLQHGPELALKGEQRQRIQQIDREWQREKARLLAAMEPPVPPQSGLSFVALQQNLGDYASLSHTYNRRRAETWNVATAALTQAQRYRIDRLAGAMAKREARP